MSKTLLKARDIEALALSTLTGSVEIQTPSAPPPSENPGSRSRRWTAAVALLGGIGLTTVVGLLLLG
jgi:hypothetical protein